MTSVIIVENNEGNIKTLINMLAERFDDFRVLSICKTKVQGISDIKKLEPELVFLDIELDDDKEGGIEILKQTREIKYSVIFTTAFNNYAQEAFEFSAIHYLIKPFTVETLFDAVQRFKSRVQSDAIKSKETFLSNLTQHNKSLKSFAIPAPGGETICRQVSEIVYSEATGSDCVFYLPGNKKQACVKGLDWAEDRLTSYNFFRCHRSYLINLDRILKFRRSGDSGYVVLSDAEFHVPVARRKVKALEQLLGL